jgi:signal transduction protein with GAF and PtsI domain
MTISTRDLHRALQELGELRFGETDVNEAMHRIVHTTHAIFDVDGAGLMLVDADQTLRNAAVSDDRLDRLETLQLEHDEGPCITAFDEKTLVCAEDLAGETRWPDFCPAARAAGLSAILASPIPYNQSAIGVVAVLSEDARPWSPEAELALMAFTDLAALMIASILHGERQTELAGQLQGALDSRAVIEQAKGILAARDRIPMRVAYEQLRARARAERRRLHEVSADLVRASVPPG